MPAGRRDVDEARRVDVEAGAGVGGADFQEFDGVELRGLCRGR